MLNRIDGVIDGVNVKRRVLGCNHRSATRRAVLSDARGRSGVPARSPSLFS